jgi:predicted ATPase
LLDRHDRIVREVVEQWRGTWVKSTGDGVLAVFEGPVRALRAAITIRERLGALGIRIRAGVHSSEIEWRRDDVAGLGVAVAARVAALGDDGDVLVTTVVRDLIAGSGIELLPRGEYALKGVPGTCDVFAVTTPEPARRAATAGAGGRPEPASNVPQPADSFLGRTDDLARLEAACAQSQLVTLAGPGGVGKTRLAVEFARTAGRDSWFVDLSRITDAAGVAAAFLDAFGVSPRTGVPAGNRLREALALRSLLLVVDNCEQVIEPVAEIVEELVRGAPDVRVLATSRQALGVNGEQVLVVAPLALPSDEAAPEAQRAADAVQMFLDRAERSGAAVDDLDAVVTLCRRLDGIPLALELAAARMRAFSPAQVLEQLDAGWSVSAPRRDRGLARHLSLADAIDWSYQLLGDDERAMLLSVSTFRAAFDVAAASAVADLDPMTTADLLTQLVDQSLLQSTTGAAGRRFRLLETVRAFALRLVDAERDAAARQRHATYFASQVETLGARIPGPDEDDAVHALAVEFDDVQTAFEFAERTADVDLAARLAYGPRLSVSNDGARFAHLAARACTVPGIERHPLHVSLLTGAAWSAVVTGDVVRARAIGARARSLVGDISTNVRLCWVWPQATGASFADGANGCLAGAAAASAVGDDAGASFLLATASIYHLAAGEERAAIDDAERGLVLARAVGSRSLRARAAGALAYALQDVDAAAARRAAYEVLEIADRGDHHLSLPHRVLAVLAWRDGDAEAAADHATQAAYLVRDHGDRYVQAASVRQLAVIISRVDTTLAAELLGVAEALLPERRVMARDEVADTRLRAELHDVLGVDKTEDLVAAGRRHDVHTIYATVERALAVMRSARLQ